MKNKKKLAAAGLALALLAGSAACSSGDADPADGNSSEGSSQVIKIGAAPTPHGEILEFINKELAPDAGLKLEIVEYTDETRLNQYLDDGDIAANYFQHGPYFNAQVEEFGYQIEALEGVHIEPYGLYSKKVKEVSELKKGAVIALTNDPVNLARALDLLEKNNLLKVADTEDAAPTLLDIEDNPNEFEFIETDPAQLVRSLDDVDAAIINGNYALDGGLNPAKDSLLLEDGANNPYANFVAIRKADTDNADLKKLDQLLHSDEVRDFITSTWPDGEVIPAF
jgi:D-methionine transport system substrate-binding protein